MVYEEVRKILIELYPQSLTEKNCFSLRCNYYAVTLRLGKYPSATDPQRKFKFLLLAAAQWEYKKAVRSPMKSIRQSKRSPLVLKWALMSVRSIPIYPADLATFEQS